MIDVVIIGSGFGGAVMAARLAAALPGIKPGARVVLLEQGDDPTNQLDPSSRGAPVNTDGNRFRNTLGPSYLSSLAQIFTDTEQKYLAGTPSMSVVTGRALGGGSQIYDGVSLRAPTEAFEQTRDGRRLWPVAYSRAALDRYYTVVEERLRVAQLAWTDASAPHWQLTTKRDWVFAEGCRRIGATAVPLKVADDDDANEGWWNEGQRLRGRQSLTLNYLLDAKNNGAELRTLCRVDTIAPTADGYVVRGTDERGPSALELECKVLIVAGGAVGSSALLLKSRPHFEGTRDLDPFLQLGKALSANGDYGVSGTVGAELGWPVEGFKGKPMASFCPSFYRQHGFILIPFYAAPLYLALGQFTTALPAANPGALGRRSTSVAAGANDWGLAYKQTLGAFGPRMLTMGCLAFDDCEGQIHLGARGVEVSWGETSRQTEARWSTAVQTMGRIYSALGGEMFLDRYRRDGTVNTSHPLGGCRMGESERLGVVNEFGESFRNPNLFVVDGAIVPSALAANPSLTIAAIGERVAEHLLKGNGTQSLSERLA